MRKNYKLFFGISVIGVALLVLVFLKNNAGAVNVPTIVSYQGKLLESGVSVTTTKSMAFLLFDSLTGGTLVYTAGGTLTVTTTISKTPENGIFTVQLGGAGTNALDASIFQNNSSIYLEVWVDGQKLTPRKQMTTSPYAFNSQYLMGFSATTTSSTVYIPVSDSYGNFTFTGTASTTGVDGGIIYINPTSAGTNKTLFGIADNGTERLRIDKEGDAWLFGALNVSSTLNVVATSTFATTTMTSSTITTANVGSLYVNGNSIFTNVSSTNISASGYLNVDSGTFYVDNVNNRVGINSSSPQYDLSVVGTSYFTGTTTINNQFSVFGKSSNPVHSGSLADGGGVAPLLNRPQAVYVSGNYAYIVSAGTSNALEIVDITTPPHPTHLGSLANGTGGALLNYPNSIYVSGNYAYIASQLSNALEIVDISNPVTPVHKGSITDGVGGALLNNPAGVFVSGNYAYVASFVSDALEIVDISNPAAPVHKGSITDGVGGALLNGAYSVYVAGNYAYVTSIIGDSLEIVDISNPAAPVHKGSLANGAGGALLDGAISIYVSGNNAYIASASASDALEIVDISNPAAPVHKGSLANGAGGALLNEPNSVYVSGHIAYITSITGHSLEIVDITNPASPIHLGSLANGTGGALLNTAYSVFVSGNYAYIASWGSNALEVVDISGATISNAEIGTTKTTNLQVMSSALFDQNVSIRGGLSIGSNGLLLSGDFGMSAPTSTNVTTATNTLSFSHTAFFKTNATTTDDAAFIFDTANTLTSGDLFTVRNNGTVRMVLDESGNLGINTTTPTFNLSVSGTMYISDLSILTNVSSTNIDASGYLNVDSGTFYVDNVNNRVGINSSTPGYSLSVGGTSYFSGTSTMTDLLDLQGKVASPILLSTYTTTSISVVDVVKVGNYAYIVDDSYGLRIIDVSSLSSPIDVSNVSIPGAKSVFVAGNYVYVVGVSPNVMKTFDVSNRVNPLLVSTLTFAFTPGKMFVSGNYAYVAAGTSGFAVVDISHQGKPQLVTTLAPPLNVTSVFVSGNYAYVTDVSAGFMVIDISKPRIPVAMDSYPSANFNSIFVSGKYAYVAENDDIRILDISNPDNVTSKSAFTTANSKGVFVSGNYAYIADGTSGLKVADISSSTLPFQKGTLATTNATRVYVSGNYAYIADGTGGLRIVDISGAIISQAEIGTAKVTNLEVLNNASFNQSLNILGGLSIGSNGLLLSGDFSMSSPTSSDITVATNTLSFSHTALFKNQASSTDDNAFIFDTVNTFTLGNLLSVRNNGSNKFVIDKNGYVGINSTTPSYYLSVEGISYFSATTTMASGLIVDGGTLFVDPANNRVGINSSTPGFSLSVLGTMYVSGNTLFENATSTYFGVTGNIFSNLLTVTATSTLASTTITYLNVDGGILTVDNINNRVGINTLNPGTTFEVNGEAAFQATTTMNNKLVVTPTLTNLTPYSSINTDGTSKDTYISGDYAYVADSASGLQIIDISDPNQTNIVGNVGGFTANSVHISGDYAYMGTSAGMKIIDISSPSAPSIVGSYSNINTPDIFVSGNYAYLSVTGIGLLVVNVSNPSIPTLVNTYAGVSSATSVEISGRFAYVTDGTSGLNILDISDPQNIRGIGVYATGANANDVKIKGKYAYVAGGTGNTLKIIDISTSTAPVLEGSLTITGSANRIFLSDNYAYLTPATNQGIRIVNVSSPSSPTLTKEYNVSMNAYGAFVSGNFLYVADGTNGLVLFDLQGARMNSLQTGSFKADAIDISGSARFSEVVNARSGLIIGSNGLLMAGDFTMSSPTSTNITTATNTLNFSHTALFKSSATATEPNIFIFDTSNAFSTSASTTYLLSVRNNGTPEFSVASNGDVTAKGGFFANSATIGAPFTPGDLAERVDISPTETVEPGDVMIVDSENSDTYKKSTTPYDDRVAGVISTQPSIIVGDARTQYSAVMAMVGRVPVKASAENGAIMRGDLLVAASTAGYAMKYDSTKDDEGRVVGIIGVALDSLATSTGKIMTLVRTGWVNNRNQTLETMQENISTIATATNVGIQNNPQNLTIQQNTDGQIAYVAGQNLDLNNSLIINVTGIDGTNGKWQIDTEGRFVTKISGTNGNSKSLYAMQSEQTDMILSGTSMLENGIKRVEFDELNSSIINKEKNIKVSITLTSEANGIFVTDKNEKGFTVKELNNGKSNASFDWVVIAERKIGDTEITNDTPTSSSENNPEPPSTSENNTSTPQIDTPSNTTPNSASSTEPNSPASQNDTTAPTQDSSNSDDSSSQITDPIVPTDEPPTETPPPETPAPEETPSASM